MILAKLTMLIILQYKHISNHYYAYTLKCNTILYVFVKYLSTTGENMATRIKRKNWHNTVESLQNKTKKA